MYTGVMAVKVEPSGWAKPVLLMHFVEESGASTVFVASDDAKKDFATCQEGRIYDIEVPGKCVRTSAGEQKHGVKTKFEVVLKLPCKITLSSCAWPFRYPYEFCAWEALNQVAGASLVDILGVALQTPTREVGGPLPKLLVELGNGDMKQTVILLGDRASVTIPKDSKVAISGLRLKEWKGERTLESSFLSIVEVNPQLKKTDKDALAIIDEGPRRKAIRMTPRTTITVSEAQGVTDRLLNDVGTSAPTTETDFVLFGTLRALTSEFFELDPPIMDTSKGERMCWKSALEDSTGSLQVRVWDKACYELFQCTAVKLRELWDEGVENPDMQDHILRELNRRTNTKVTCYCTATVWSAALKKVKQEVQANINALELPSESASSRSNPDGASVVASE